jgi:aspartate/methionine/tyrosine aminotransferase
MDIAYRDKKVVGVSLCVFRAASLRAYCRWLFRIRHRLAAPAADALSASKTRLIILNGPHNPSGALIYQAELDSAR